MSLLDLVQDILSDMDSDAVNSITDTEESEQVAKIISTTYMLMMSSRDWPHTRKLVNLISSGSSSLPTHMTFSDTIKRVDEINYNKRKSTDTKDFFQEVPYKYPDNFLRFVNGRNSSSSTVDTIVDPSGVNLLILNNVAPSFYTSFDDETIVFDSHDNLVDSTLQSNKTQVMAYLIPEFNLDDDFIPDLPVEAFGELLETSKVKAQAKLRQFEDAFSLAESRKQSTWNSRNAWNVKGGTRYPNYGRKSGGDKHPTFKKGN